MAMSLAELTKQLNQNTYTSRTDEQLKKEAETRYKSTYDQMKLTAQQAQQTQDQAYQRQLNTLAAGLETNKQSLIKDTADSLASANRYLLTRGMQRSSYGAANAAKIQTTGQNNLTALLKQYETDRDEIEGSRTLLAQQLAQTLAQYDIDYLNDVQKYIDEQKNIDYDREQAALKNQNDILMALYEYGLAQQKSTGGGGGGSGKASSSTPLANKPVKSTGVSLFDKLKSGAAAVVKNPLKTNSKQPVSKKTQDFAAAMSGL